MVRKSLSDDFHKIVLGRVPHIGLIKYRYIRDLISWRANMGHLSTQIWSPRDTDELSDRWLIKHGREEKSKHAVFSQRCETKWIMTSALRVCRVEPGVAFRYTLLLLLLHSLATGGSERSLKSYKCERWEWKLRRSALFSLSSKASL